MQNNSTKDLRTIQLIGNENFNKLKKSHVMVVGLGGVGGYALEQLARVGIEKFTIIDCDKISESNINRQIIADYNNIGQYKVDEFERRIKLINPNAKVEKLKLYIDSEVSLFDKYKPDYVVDAIDTLRPKVSLILHCVEYNIPVVSALGAGGITNPEMVKTVDIADTYNDGLGRMLRKRLHKHGVRTGFKAVFSPEKIPTSTITYEQGLHKKTNVGSISYMPAVFGIHCAAAVISDLTNSK